MDKYIVKYGKVYDDDGNVAVLISPGHIGGPWNDVAKEYKNIVAFYPPLVLFLLGGGVPGDLVDDRNITPKGEEILLDLAQDTGKGKNAYRLRGLSTLEIEWVAPEKSFRIDEYDGYETIVYLENHHWYNT